MVISVWMIGVLWLVLSTVLYIWGIPKMFGGSLKGEWWVIKVTIFLMCMLMIEVAAFVLYVIGLIAIELFTIAISADWMSFLNHELIYIK